MAIDGSVRNSRTRVRRPRPVGVAAVLASLYAVVVAGVAVSSCCGVTTGAGTLATRGSGGPCDVGVAIFSLILFGFAALLVVGAWRGAKLDRTCRLVAPLLVFLALGVVGEIQTSRRARVVSNTIGAVILVLAATPVVISATSTTRALPSGSPVVPSTSQK